MFDVIDFLERVGQNAQLRHASRDDVGLVLSGVAVNPELHVAILAGGGQELQTLLGQNPFCCLINPAKPDEEQEEGDDSCEDDEEKKDKDKDKEKDERRNGN
ncbi:hypothetical protein [Rhodanobacter thiooxydans]|uniref:hypothetical protein n=1 Tax=Rhodanobacter thiooxydans TaxID=416169 RepID=UPI000260E2FF|nr:hypothetical protein [Rhodanobacter thiooxydans]EIL97416.1 hypothetical protein UUA_15031 [Rhodanobacter thiooxydans LCS2]MCW0201863.1 hypothetical protein [Rhodanobacter thiooxydans]